MKLNLTFIPFNGQDKQYKVVAYGDKDALYSVAESVQKHNFCINVYMTEDEKKQES